MTSLLARVGALEARLASQIQCASLKRKRTGWTCAECKARRALRQRRAYANGSLNISPDQYIFPPKSFRNEQDDENSPPTSRGHERKLRWGSAGAWGLPTDDSSSRLRNEETEMDEMASAVETQQESLWEQFEQVEEDTTVQAQEPAALKDLDLDLDGKSALLEIDYAVSLPQALLNDESDLVARCLYAAAQKNDLEFIRSIPATTFADCIRALRPSKLTEKLSTTHVEISEAMSNQLGLMSIQSVAWQHARVLKEIIGIRSSAGIRLGMAEYRMLLRSARDLGQTAFAVRLWDNLSDQGFTPDTAMYNDMMASIIWRGVHRPIERQRVRVIPFFQLMRTRARPLSGFSNYKVGTVGGVKVQVKWIFSDMLKHGAVADEESFSNVIIAAAREGDVATVKSILRKVWDVDVDALMAGTSDSTSTPKSIDRSSPLYPTSKLLFTIAHAFGINNSVPTALRVVDYVARTYDIHITREVWDQLFEWTFVLAVPRTGLKARTDGTRTGQLPKQSVLNLWDTMTGAPYFIKPTMGMYNHLIKNLYYRSFGPAMYGKMREGRLLYTRSRRNAKKCLKRLERAIQLQNKDDLNYKTCAESVEQLRRNWEHADLIRKRNLHWCKRWLRLLLLTSNDYSRMDSRRADVDRGLEWTIQKLPSILWNWRHLAPTVVKYSTRDGIVELTFRTDDEMQQNQELIEARAEKTKKVLDEVPLLIGEDWMQPRSQQGQRRRSWFGRSVLSRRDEIEDDDGGHRYVE